MMAVHWASQMVAQKADVSVLSMALSWVAHSDRSMAALKVLQSVNWKAGLSVHSRADSMAQLLVVRMVALWADSKAASLVDCWVDNLVAWKGVKLEHQTAVRKGNQKVVHLAVQKAATMAVQKVGLWILSSECWWAGRRAAETAEKLVDLTAALMVGQMVEYSVDLREPWRAVLKVVWWVAHSVEHLDLKRVDCWGVLWGMTTAALKASH
jgi:hypothetical protein